MSPYTAAAGPGLMPGRLDAIIDPLDTRIPLRRDRLWISMGIEAASQAPANREFNMGGASDMIAFQLTIAVGLFSLVGLLSSTAPPEQPLTTKNISFFFKENSTELVSDSAWCMQCCGVAELVGQLDTLANVLKENPTIVLEIGGHADAREHLPDSFALARAEFIVNALVQRSIAPARLQAVSYGSMQPLMEDVQLAQMQTEEERADARGHNRRAWPKVISYDYKP